jgi:hypothetical protein
VLAALLYFIAELISHDPDLMFQLGHQGVQVLPVAGRL